MDELNHPLISVERYAMRYRFSTCSKSRRISLSVVCVMSMVIVYILRVIDFNGVFLYTTSSQHSTTDDGLATKREFHQAAASTHDAVYWNKQDDVDTDIDDLRIIDLTPADTDIEPRTRLNLAKRDLSQSLNVVIKTRDFIDEAKVENTTIFPLDVASNETIYVTQGESRDRDSRDSLRHDASSTENMEPFYQKILDSLRKLIGIGAKDQSTSPEVNKFKFNVTNVTNITSASSVSSDMINMTLVPALYNWTIYTTSSQIVERTTYSPKGDVVSTSGRSSWWNSSCWTSLESEICDARTMEDLRTSIFDVVTLRHLDARCRPGEWCLGDDVQFDRVTSPDELRQLCNSSKSCIDRLRSTEQRCDVGSHLNDDHVP